MLANLSGKKNYVANIGGSNAYVVELFVSDGSKQIGEHEFGGRNVQLRKGRNGILGSPTIVIGGYVRELEELELAVSC